MLETLDKYMEIAKYLEDESCYNDLEFVKNSLCNKEFLLTFVGQFSSGKSKLINNIINRDLLPVKIVESTQVPTFIKYGVEEKAFIFYESGEQKEITIDEIKDIWLGNKTDNFDSMEHIEIFIKDSVLKQGLIIADTPGVNSTVKKHEKLTRNIIRSSEEIVYIISKPITEVDKVFLNQIIEMGFKAICVRTFMDTIKSSEESIEDVLNYDKRTIKEIGNDSVISIYHVSNDSQSIWFNEISKLRYYISIEISSKIEERLKENNKLRVEKIKNDLKEQLEQKIENLNTVIDGNEEKIKLEIEKINKIIKGLENLLKKESLNYDIEYRNIKKDARNDLKETKENILNNIKKELDNIDISDDVEEKMQNMIYPKLSYATNKLQSSYINPFENFIYDKSIFIEERLNEISQNIDIEYYIPSDLNELIIYEQDNDNKIEEIKRSILELASEIEKKEEKLETIKSNIEEYNLEKYSLQEAVKNVEKQLSELGDYKPQYLEIDAEFQPSQTLKKIGMGLDWATLLIPGKAYTNMASKLGKGIGVVEKVAQGAKKADTVKDGLFVFRNIKNTIKSTYRTKKRTARIIEAGKKINEVKNSTGLLDYMTFEYWFEKIGENFDKPPILEIDREYEREYIENKKELENKYKKVKYDEINKMKRLGIIKNEEERLKYEKDIDIKRKKQLEQNLLNKEKQMQENARKRAIKVLKNKYFDFFKNSIEDISEKVIVESDKYLEIPLKKYYEKCIANFKFEINKNKQDKEDILNRFNNDGIKDIKKELDTCMEYKILLGENINGRI